jgi:hypothetical protein
LLPEKPNKLVFHKNLEDLFHLFPSTTFENTLLVDDMPHKSTFNLRLCAIFFDTFYMFNFDSNYLLGTIFPYLESLHSSKMQVYKFIELNPFGSIIDVLLGDSQYQKLDAHCFPKCDETLCNRMKSRFTNKKKLILLFIYLRTGIKMCGFLPLTKICGFYLLSLALLS